MTLVVDASAAINWVVQEEGHVEVLQRSAGQRLAAPHPVYDCLYLACATDEEAELLTADKRLAEVARRAGVPVVLVAGGVA